MFRVGFGFDVHRLEAGRAFWLGGVKLDHPYGAMGHSDADALIHAICDAILGAANLKDIGYHFSDKDPKWKDIDSKILLKESTRLVREKGFEIGNIDATVVLEAPKISKYIDDMASTMAQVMNIDKDQISIKATTNEVMGFVGRREGIACHAVALINK